MILGTEVCDTSMILLRIRVALAAGFGDERIDGCDVFRFIFNGKEDFIDIVGEVLIE